MYDDSGRPAYTPPALKAPSTRVDGFPVAVTSDVGVRGRVSDMGTGTGYQRRWTQASLDAAADAAAAGLARDEDGVAPAAERITRG
ncbi:hypothetical protein WPS_20730 [Vulcanimicrobium alpinum]|uniref:Uncharacterized protein n=1 Tax=Vulcanimicrobium alpinum TaxID=3016050 RepID=A0AAN1XWS5_UNVUL|nr:hypothetical protein WPS_20730 [Vulcanimicrobium alpinum]